MYPLGGGGPRLPQDPSSSSLYSVAGDRRLASGRLAGETICCETGWVRCWVLHHTEQLVVGQNLKCLFGDGYSTVVFLEGFLGVHRGTGV